MNLSLLRKIKFYNLKNKNRAAHFGAALFFFIHLSSFASKLAVDKQVINRQTSEAAQDLINKSENLMLQKDRTQSLFLLDKARTQTLQDAKLQLEIKKRISSISRTFLSDKAQQLYELSASTVLQDPAASLAKATEALKIEPDHLLLLLFQSKLFLSKLECKSAQEVLGKIPPALYSDDDVILLMRQIKLCQLRKNESEFLSQPQVQVSINHEKEIWAVINLEELWTSKQTERAQEKLKQYISEKIDHPDLVYWQYKIMKGQEKSKTMIGQKYILNCKNLSLRQQRKYLQDPYLCARTAEIEDELKKMSNQNEK